MRKNKLLIAASIIILCCMLQQTRVFASDGEKYITISVDATDDSGNLKYAIDTDDPAAFTDSNEFTVLAGTDHTIYVRDAAGNITSQEYTYDNADQSEGVAAVSTSSNKNEQQIDIELDISRNPNSSETDFSNYEYLTDDPIEPGTGTVAEKVITDGSDDAERLFYTFTTKEGETLYLVIDQSRSADNVYLLDTVSASDLLVLADSSGGNSTEKEEDNLLAALSKESAADNETVENDTRDSNSSSNSNLLIVIIVVFVGGGVYYYFKIYKNKKEESMDSIDEAMDMEDFEPEEEEEEEIDFDDEEKEKFLEDLIGGDENLYDADPNEYAAAELETEMDMSNFADDFDFGLEDDEEKVITEALSSIEDEEFEEDV